MTKLLKTLFSVILLFLYLYSLIEVILYVYSFFTSGNRTFLHTVPFMVTLIVISGFTRLIYHKARNQKDQS
jgi:hypothetical protein